MHHKFVDWYQPVSFGHDRETLGLRWQGIESVMNNIDFEMAGELIRLTFDRPMESPNLKNTFRQYFKDIDPLFLTTGNDLEVLTLAGCVLAILCDDNDNDFGEVALAILTASACGIRNPKVELDLVGMAAERVQTEGVEARKRPTMSALKKIQSGKQFVTAISPLEQTQDFPQIIKSMTDMGTKTVSLLKSVQDAASTEIANIQHIFTAVPLTFTVMPSDLYRIVCHV